MFFFGNCVGGGETFELFKILGKIECYQGGHELSNMFLRKLLKFQKNYLIIELEDTIISKKTNSERAVKIAVNA